MRKRPAKKEVLKVVPVRNPNINWEMREDGLIELCVPIKQDLVTRIMKRMIRNLPETRTSSSGTVIPPPDTRTVLLDDEVASEVWLACDGSNTINTIISRIAGKFKLQRRQSETSTTLFLQTLSKKKLIMLTDGRSGKTGK